MRILCILALMLPVAACQQAPGPHYVVGKPYISGGIWRYPQESFDLTQTGLATVFSGTTPTADGEAWSNRAMLAASPTLQLPAAIRVTNLNNGLQAILRVNDRGPTDPGRLIGVSPLVASLLGEAGSTAFPVRVEVLSAQSQALAAALEGHATTLKVAAAPTGAVATQSLAPPPGAAGSAGAVTQAAPRPRESLTRNGPVMPLRPPEELSRVAPNPGRLYVDCGGVSKPIYAEELASRLAQFGAEAVPDYSEPLTEAFRARIGPLPSVAAADAMLARVLRAGIANARIVVK